MTNFYHATSILCSLNEISFGMLDVMSQLSEMLAILFESTETDGKSVPLILNEKLVYRAGRILNLSLVQKAL